MINISICIHPGSFTDIDICFKNIKNGEFCLLMSKKTGNYPFFGGNIDREQIEFLIGKIQEWLNENEGSKNDQ